MSVVSVAPRRRRDVRLSDSIVTVNDPVQQHYVAMRWMETSENRRKSHSKSETQTQKEKQQKHTQQPKHKQHNEFDDDDHDEDEEEEEEEEDDDGHVDADVDVSESEYDEDDGDGDDDAQADDNKNDQFHAPLKTAQSDSPGSNVPPPIPAVLQHFQKHGSVYHTPMQQASMSKAKPHSHTHAHAHADVDADTTSTATAIATATAATKLSPPLIVSSPSPSAVQSRAFMPVATAAAPIAVAVGGAVSQPLSEKSKLSSWGRFSFIRHQLPERSHSYFESPWLRAIFVLLLLCCLFFTLGLVRMAKMVAFLFPAYKTAKAIMTTHSNRRNSQNVFKRPSNDRSVLRVSNEFGEDDGNIDAVRYAASSSDIMPLADFESMSECAHWVRCWLCLAAFTVLEPVCDLTISSFPYYVFLKAAFLLTVSLHRSSTVRWLYIHAIRPLLWRHHHLMQRILEFMGHIGTQFLAEVRAILWMQTLYAISKLRTQSPTAAKSDSIDHSATLTGNLSGSKPPPLSVSPAAGESEPM